MPATHSAEAALETLHVLDGHRLGAFEKRLVWTCMLALAGDTAEIVLVVLLPSACALDPEQGNVTGVLAAAACVGQMFGAALFASSADAFGRRQVFIACGAIVAIAGLASAWAQGIARLALLRGIVGIGVGGGAALSAVLMVEFLPEESRGKILLQTRALSSFGGIYVTLAAWLVLASRGWRLLAAIVALPAIVSVVITRNLLPESPRWLQRRGRAAEAAAVVARVAEDNGVDLPPGALKLCEPERQWVSWRARRRVEEMRHQQLLEDHVPQDRHHLLDEFDTESVASSASSDQDDDDEGHDLEDLRCLCCCCRSTEHSEAALERSDVDISCDDCYAEYGDGYRRNETGHYDAGFFGSEANPSTTLPAYGAAKGTFASAFERINPILRRRKYTDSSSCRRCLQRKPFRNDGAALARALRSPDGSYRHPRIAIWIGGAYVATATLSSLLFAQATHENARHLLSGTTASSTDECKSAIDYGGLTAGSFAEIMTTALVSLVVDLGRKRVIFVLLVVAAFQLFVLSSVTLGALFTTVVSLTARAALFAANAVAWAFAAELYPTETRATGASHAAACSRLGGAMASMFVVARFSPVREHVEEGPTLESWHFASVSMAALLASFFVLLIPVDTASKPAAEAPLIPRRRQRHATKSFPGKDEYWKSRLLRESTQHLESIASTKANRGPKAAEDTDDTYTI